MSSLNTGACIKVSVFLLLMSCGQGKTNDSSNTWRTAEEESFIAYFSDKGNRKRDTFRLKGKLVDPVDDTLAFKRATFNFYVDNKGLVYIKTQTYGYMSRHHLTVEYFKDVSDVVDLSTYREIEGDRYFVSRGQVFFWWANSGGSFALKIDGADAGTFRPANSFCGGYDKYGVLYGSPNWGIYRLNIDNIEDIKLVPKEGSYWNTPEHFLISGTKIYDVKFDSRSDSIFSCELNTDVSVTDVEEMLK